MLKNKNEKIKMKWNGKIKMKNEMGKWNGKMEWENGGDRGHSKTPKKASTLRP